MAFLSAGHVWPRARNESAGVGVDGLAIDIETKLRHRVKRDQFVLRSFKYIVFGLEILFIHSDMSEAILASYWDCSIIIWNFIRLISLNDNS